MLALILISAVFAWRSPFFLSADNLLNVALQSATNIVLAIGMTFVIASAGIDLSVGAFVALTGVTMGLAAKAGLGVGGMFAAGFATGTGAGSVNGLLIARSRVAPFVATLATMSVARGLALIVTGTRPIYGMPDGFAFLGTGRIAGIPVPVLIALVVAGAAAFLLGRTTFGRYTLAIGGNEEAARLAGVPVARDRKSVV